MLSIRRSERGKGEADSLRSILCSPFPFFPFRMRIFKRILMRNRKKKEKRILFVPHGISVSPSPARVEGNFFRSGMGDGKCFRNERFGWLGLEWEIWAKGKGPRLEVRGPDPLESVFKGFNSCIPMERNSARSKIRLAF